MCANFCETAHVGGCIFQRDLAEGFAGRKSLDPLGTQELRPKMRQVLYYVEGEEKRGTVQV